jgi:hypothetical protein
LRLKRLFATVLLALGISGGIAALMPAPASALCVRVNVTVFGTRVGTGSNFTCVP